MAEITASLVKQLRDKTNAAMMKCKEALVEANGDLEQAETILRKKGIERAGSKSSRTASEGIIAARIQDARKLGVLVEVNCETDFVAKNENFQQFVAGIADQLADGSGSESVEDFLREDSAAQPGSSVENAIKAKIAEIGENILVRRFRRLAVDGPGKVASYIHLQGKVGVLLSVDCDPALEGNEAFDRLVKDITLHIAAAQPVCIGREEIPRELVEREREIYREQVKGKPENIVDRIVDGKLEKYFSTVCLLEQGFIKDPDQTVGKLLEASGKELGGNVEVRDFVRFAVGEEVAEAG